MLRIGLQFFAKKKSSQKAYFINTGTSGSPNWASLGKGVTKLDLSYNPQVTTETYIIEDNATSSIDGYQTQASTDVSLWDAVSAPAHAYLENLRDTRATGEDAESQILEVDLDDGSPYNARLSDIVIAVDKFGLEGGKPQVLSPTFYFNGDPTPGTVVITNGTPVFTPTGVAALALSSIVPEANATDVSVSSAITLTFSNKIKSENIIITSAAGVAVSITRSWNAAGTVLTLTPSADLTAETTYLVAIAGVVDIYNQALTASISKFTTA